MFQKSRRRVLECKQSLRLKRACVRILDSGSDDGRSELLQTRVFTLVSGESYRAHGEKLFEFSNGAWSPATRGLSAGGLECLSHALRLAQAYLNVLSQQAVPRDFEAVAFHIKAMHYIGQEEILLQWQLQDVVPRKVEERAKHWTQGLAELCKILRHQFNEHHKTILKQFMRWSDELLRPQAGLCFADCYLSSVDGVLRQYKKDFRHNCYISIPCSLSISPTLETRKRYASILLSSFAGGSGLQVLLDQAALVVAGVRQPDVMHFIVGEGHDGKSLIFIDHLKAVFGSSFGNAPASMLQTEREWQVQGANFLHSAFICFDEAKRDHPVMEEVLKLFVSGGQLPLRANHAADTRYGSWELCGKAWTMNTADVPCLPSAQERSHARRIRCTYMRSRFVHLESEVDASKRFFAADRSTKNFMSSPEAVWCWYNDMLFPHLKRYGVQACSDRLESPAADGQTAADTAWLLKRMSRSSRAPSPDVSEAEDSCQPSRSEQLVRETHSAIESQFFSAADVNRLSIAANPGSTKGHCSKKSRVGHLKDALADFPNLVRQVQGQKRGGVTLDRFERRQVDVGDWERMLASIAEPSDTAKVFGSWATWSWPPPAEAWEDPESEAQAFPNGMSWSIECHLDLQKLEDYSGKGMDRRPDQLQAFLRKCKEEMGRTGSASSLVCMGQQKLVLDDTSLGRAIFPWASLSNLTREARAAASPPESIELDMPNAVVFFALEVASENGLELPAFQLYYDNKHAWRRAVGKWLDLCTIDAKKMLLRAVFGFAYGSCTPTTRVRVCPLLDALAADAECLKSLIASSRPELVDAMHKAGRKRPRTSSLAYTLFDREHACLQQLVGLLPEFGYRLVTPVFDAVVAVPSDTSICPDPLVQEFFRQRGVQLQVEAVHAGEPRQGVTQIVSNMVAKGQGVTLDNIVRLPGEAMCVPIAVMNLFPDHVEEVSAAFRKHDGPFAYRAVMELCPHVLLEPMPIESLSNAKAGSTWLVHDPRCVDGKALFAEGPCWPGHCCGVLVEDKTTLVYSSHQDESSQVSKSLFCAELAKIDGVKVYSVNWADAEPAQKHRRKLSGTVCPVELELEAGAEDIIGDVYKMLAQEVVSTVLLQTEPVADLLATAARLIRTWVCVDESTSRFLQSQNHIDLVLLLTAVGPRYVIKQQTVHAQRLNKAVYYQSDFANLLVAKALLHRGKVHAIFTDLAATFVAAGCLCASLGCRRRETRTELVREVLNLPYMQAFRGRLLDFATARNEWVSLSHDATYQVLFSLIGQRVMQQREGEAHALHTILGRSGGLAGLSLQHTEGSTCFRAAVADVLPLSARQSVLYVFSDSPEAVEGATDVLPELRAVAEDALHLVLRVEGCYGERRSSMSSFLLRLQGKFKHPVEAELYHGNSGSQTSVAWEGSTARDWEEVTSETYLSTPYQDHADYVQDLRAVREKYATEMKRRDQKGRTVEQVLAAGSSYKHYRYLLNGSIIRHKLRAMLPAKEYDLLSCGTCANEALHFQLKAAEEAVVQQHREQAALHLSAFALA
ncbi:unnamed protein product [Symbiodinium sp. CCMP2592]|nr:unnamed protein product [Symbiodinium sp. CCMP2592]